MFRRRNPLAMAVLRANVPARRWAPTPVRFPLFRTDGPVVTPGTQDFQRLSPPRPRPKDRQLRRHPARRGPGEVFPRRRDQRADHGKHPWARCVHHPADLSAGEPQPDGVAHPRGRGPARERGTDHGGDALLRLRPAGPQGSSPRADHGEARGKSHRRRRG